MSPSYSESKKPEKQQVASRTFHVGFLPGSFFDPEDESNIFFRNVG
jgi:hypothetical protein